MSGPPPPEDFHDREAVEAWLRTQPREVSVALAVRAALRVAPMLSFILDSSDAGRYLKSIVLTFFRVAAETWFATANEDIAEITESALSAAARARDARDLLNEQNNQRAAPASHAYVASAAAGQALIALKVPDVAAAAAATLEVSYSSYRFAFSATANPISRAHMSIHERQREDDETELIFCDLLDFKNREKFYFQIISPLWNQRNGHLAKKRWDMLRAHLLAAGEDWDVWVDWYERRLAGGAPDLSLEWRYVDIDDALWNQGPAVVNAEIKRRIEALNDERRANEATAPSADDIAALLRAPSLRVALADFAYDDLSRLMRMVAFPEDLAALAADGAEARAADDLSALGADARDLVEDADPARKQAPREFHRDLERYATEAARGPRRFNPRRLWSLGGALHRWRLDDDLRYGLGPHLAAKLDDLCAAHLDLMRTYFAAALARLRGADKLALAPDATPEAMVAPLKRALRSLDEDDWSHAPGADEEARAVLASQLEELDAEIKAIGRARDPDRRAELERDVERKAKMTASTLTRMGLRSGETALKGAHTAATAKALFPENYDKAIEALKSLLPDLPWF